LTPIVLLGLAYLLGSIPTSYWIGRGIYGVNLREMGSGNLGATNALRVLGWKGALPVLLVDMAKGTVPVALFPALVPSLSFSWTLAFGGAAIVGHVFSIWVGFRGGKGVATSAGVFLGLAPQALGAAFLIWGVALWLSRTASVASLSAAVALPPLVWFFGGTRDGATPLFWFSLGLSVFVLWAHRSNLRRLMAGEEPRLRRRSAPMPRADGLGEGGETP